MVIENIRECLLKRGIGAAELARGTGIDQARLEDGLYNGEDLSTLENIPAIRRSTRNEK